MSILLPKEYLIIKGVVQTIEHAIEDYRAAKADGQITWDEVLDGIKDIVKNLILGAFLGIDEAETQPKPVAATEVDVSQPGAILDDLPRELVEKQIAALDKMGVKLGIGGKMAIDLALSKWETLTRAEKIQAIDKAMDGVEGLFVDKPVLSTACKTVRALLGVPDDNPDLGT